MVDLKRPTNYSEQINKLKEHNIRIDKTSDAKEYLQQIGYYRLTGYMIQFRSRPDSGYLDPNFKVSLNDVRSIYEFDRELRLFLLHYLGIIEVYFRSIISYEASRLICTKPPYDQHYNRNKYKDKKEFDAIKEKLEKKLDRYDDWLFVQHHKKKYEGKYPLWAWVEMMSFTTLSKYFSCLPDYVQERISKRLTDAGAGALGRDMHSLSVLRNSCAHAGRLYNKVLNPPPHFPGGFKDTRPDFKINKLFAFIYAAIQYLPTQDLKKAYIYEFDQIIQKYQSKIEKEKFDLHSTIGLTRDYVDLLAKNEKSKVDLWLDSLSYYELKKENEKRKKYWEKIIDRRAKIMQCIITPIAVLLPLAILSVFISQLTNLSNITKGIKILAVVLTLLLMFLTGLIETAHRKIGEKAKKIITLWIKRKLPPQDKDFLS